MGRGSKLVTPFKADVSVHEQGVIFEGDLTS